MTPGGYGWKLATDPDDVAHLLSGSEPYSQPVRGTQVTAAWTGSDVLFHVFYQPPDPAQPPESWGWKLAPDPADAMSFLNGTGAYCQPVKDARIASVWRDGCPQFYIFYTYELVPARIVDCQVREATAAPLGFAHLCLAWTYCTGERPQKLEITVFRSEGSGWTNIMPDRHAFKVPRPETTTEAEAMILQLSKGPHKIVFCATYADRQELEYTFDRMI